MMRETFGLLDVQAARADVLVRESRRLQAKALAGLSLAEAQRYDSIIVEMRELNLMREGLLAACTVKAPPNGA
jgi:hypothetical protein